MAGVDADEAGPAAEVGLDQFERAGEAALGVRRRGDPHRQAGRGEAEHGARVRAMGGDECAVFEPDVDEEALVALHEPPALQGEGKRIGAEGRAREGAGRRADGNRRGPGACA